MATEQEELQLTVALDDQATAQLANLHQQLLTITNLTAPAARALSQLSQNLKQTGGHAQQMHSSLAGMAARGGFIAGFFTEVGRSVEQMVKEFTEAVLDIKAYADNMVSLDDMSRRAATSMGQFRANVATLRESGLSPEEAQKILGGYADALAQLQRPGNRIVQDLLRGQQGVYRERMEDLVRTIMTSSQQAGINAIKAAGASIREEWERRGQAERGAQAEAAFFARLGMPGLEKVRGQLQEASQEEERMYNDRRKDAERYQTALNKQSEAWHATVESVQAIGFELLPISATSEKVAEFFQWMAEGAQAFERSLRTTNAALDEKIAEEARKKVVTPEGKEITGQEDLSGESAESKRKREILQRRYNPRRTTTTREGERLPPPETPTGMDLEFDPWKYTPSEAERKKQRRRPATTPAGTGSYRRYSLLGSEVDTGEGGPGVDVAALGIPSIGELLGPVVNPDATVPGDLGAGTGWRGLPLSNKVTDLRGERDQLPSIPISLLITHVDEQTESLGQLTNEVDKLNEYLQPELIRMLLAGGGGDGERPFHNAPQGGTEGESNPMQLPADSSQPGGGAAAEARQPRVYQPPAYQPPTGSPLIRQPKPGEDPIGYYLSKGARKPIPILDTSRATAQPLPVGYNENTGAKGAVNYSGVTEGTGIPTWYGQGQGWGDPSSMDKPGSNALRVPENLQGIALPSEKTLGQFFYEFDSNTGQVSLQQQTDYGPGVRTQKLVDNSVAMLQRQGYDKKTYEAVQDKIEQGKLQPFEVQNTDFYTYGRSTKPAASGKIPTETTQKIYSSITGQEVDPRQPGTHPGWLGRAGSMDEGDFNPFADRPTGMDVAGDLAPSERKTGMDIEFNPFKTDSAGGSVGAGAGGSVGAGGSFGGGGASAVFFGGGSGPEGQQAPGVISETIGAIRGSPILYPNLTAEQAVSRGAGQSFLEGREASPGTIEDRRGESALSHYAGTAGEYAKAGLGGGILTRAGEVSAAANIQPSFGVDWGAAIDKAAEIGPPQYNTQTGERELRPGEIDLDRNPLDSSGATLDKAAAGVDVNKSGSLKVEVNAPAGTTVKAEGDGVFDKTETTRTVPMESQQEAQ